MKVLILAGGLGTRLSEYTHSVPKPMIEIGHQPILCHIMDFYSGFGFNDFVVALGYKGEFIKDYFLRQHAYGSDISIDLSSGSVRYYPKHLKPWNVTLVDTGADTMTGGRILRLRDYFEDTFLLTYGDGLSNVNLNELITFHKQSNSHLTLTAVNPASRYGELNLSDTDQVMSFTEKPNFTDHWINGGFMVAEPDLFRYIEDDETILEASTMPRLAAENKLSAYKHYGFWQCMDTVRDKMFLQSIYDSGTIPWQYASE